MAITRTSKNSVSAFKKFDNTKADTAGLGLFWATTNSNVYTSPDGITWTNRGTAAGVCLFADGVYWASSFYSADAITWTSTLANRFSASYFKVAPNQTFCGGGAAGGQIIPGLTGGGYSGLGAANIAPYQNGDKVIYSTNSATSPSTYATADRGKTWVADTNLNASINTVAAGPNIFVAVGSTLFSSPTGATWTNRLSVQTYSLLTWVGNLFIAQGGASTTFYTSPDGLTWTARSLSLSTQIREAAYGAGLYVVVGDGGRIYTSPDGATWTLQTSGTANQFVSVNYY